MQDKLQELTDKLYNHISAQGNFGRKSTAANKSSINALYGGRGNLIGRLRYEQKSGLCHWKAARRHKALRPFAWIYGIGHHIYMIIRLKQLPMLSASLDESSERIKLMKELNCGCNSSRSIISRPYGQMLSQPSNTQIPLP